MKHLFECMVRSLVTAGLIMLIAFQSLCFGAGPGQRVNDALSVVSQFTRIPEHNIPKGLLCNCHGLAIFPSVYKAGFVIGASFGKGLFFMKDPATGRWYGPSFIMLAGGSIGWQIGIQATDLVLVIMNRRGAEAFMNDNLTLGGDLSVAAGPVGRRLQMGTDIALRAEAYSYSRNKGFFAGVSLDGTYIRQDYKANELYYKRPLTPREILTGQVSTIAPQSAKRITNMLERLCTPKGGGYGQL